MTDNRRCRDRSHPEKHGGRRGISTETIVVGVDGSEGSRRALRWAAGDARLRHARLRPVLVWEPPVHIVAGAGWTVPDARELERAGSRAEERLREILEEEAPALDGLEVEPTTAHGSPAQGLLDASGDAAVLVVGTRGHGGFVGLLLGSVSQQCALHASCPVVVVPPPHGRPQA